MSNPGKMDKLIELQQKTVTKGTSGGMVSTWSEFATVWADMRNPSGNERGASTAGGGQVAVARTEFGIRYRPGVTEQLRVVYQGKFYNIRHVNNINEANVRLVLTCDTGISNG